MLARQKSQKTSSNEHLLPGLIATLSECINGLLVHHGRYAKSLRGRGQVPYAEVARYLERRFAQQLRLLAKQQYAILETTEFTNGKLDVGALTTLDKLVKGRQLEEFYWEALLGLAAFLRMVFAELLRDEVGNSHTGRQLNTVWKAFLTEIDAEIQQYQLYRAYRNSQANRGRESQQKGLSGGSPTETWGMPETRGSAQNWNPVPNNDGGPFRSPDSQRRSM